METADLVTPVFERISGALLEKSKFGKAEGGALPLFWIKADRIRECAQAIREVGFDNLENLFAMQVEENILFTYFVRKAETREALLLRVSVEIKSAARVKLESVSPVWSTAAPFEYEIADLFGVEIAGHETRNTRKEFPLRKSYQPPGMAEIVSP